MRGFFTRQETQSTSRPDGRVHSCASCGMYQNVETPRMKPWGNYGKRIMIICEAPTPDDDARGRPCQGAPGRLLRTTYRKHGIDIEQDCLVTHSVFCATTDAAGEYRLPTGAEVASCRSRLIRLVKQHKPRLVILHGGAAVDALIGYRWRRDLGSINKWRGFAIPDREFDTWLCPTFSPTLVAKRDGFAEVATIWNQDIANALALVNKPLPVYPPEEQCVEVGSIKATLRAVRAAVAEQLAAGRAPLMAIDLETTGLKPYNTAVQQIACISFSLADDKAWVMPAPSTPVEIKALTRLLIDPRIRLVAANMKFEDTWLKVIYDIDITTWTWDTMLAAHVIDNRPGITGLKFQSYAHFGVVGYDDEVGPYLRSENPDTPNRVMECMNTPTMRRKLMMYCGIDSLMTRRLALVQSKELGFEDISYHA